MQLRMFMGIVCLAGTAAFSAGSLSAAEPESPICLCAAPTDQRDFPQEASLLLQEVRSVAAQLADHADNLEALVRSGSSWHSQAAEWTQARGRINSIGSKLQLLEEIRGDMRPSQQEAMDSIVPAAVTAAAHAEAAIRHLNENRRFLWADSYASQVRGLSESAARIEKRAGLHLDIEEAQNRLNSLKEEAASL
jgi:hypothetical protein